MAALGSWVIPRPCGGGKPSHGLGLRGRTLTGARSRKNASTSISHGQALFKRRQPGLLRGMLDGPQCQGVVSMAIKRGREGKSLEQVGTGV